MSDATESEREWLRWAVWMCGGSPSRNITPEQWRIEDAALHMGVMNDDEAPIQLFPAAWLAFVAVVFVEQEMLKLDGHGGWRRENYAEAEALLRCGWSP